MLTRTPYGVANAAATFMALMDGVLHPPSDHAKTLYIDDVLVFIKTSFHDSIKHIQSVFDRPRQHNGRNTAVAERSSELYEKSGRKIQIPAH